MSDPATHSRILFVNSELPHFDRTSGGLRLLSLIDVIRAAGHRCDYLLTTPVTEEARLGSATFALYLQALRELGVGIVVPPVMKALSEQRYAVIFFEFYITAEPYMPLVRAFQPSAKVVIDSVDLTYLRWHAKADLSGSAADRAHAKAVEQSELATYERADLVITITESETAELHSRLPGLPVFQVPNIHRLPEPCRNESSEPTLLFIGSFTHEPNIDAVRYFWSDIWPIVKSAEPRLRWVVIGQNPPMDILSIQGDDVAIMGRVADTAPYLARCWVSIAPIRFGAGMKGKVGEALAAGVPVVATSFGVQGYHVEHGRSALIADTPAAFAQGVLSLVRDDALRRRVGDAGRELIRHRFSRQSVADQIPEFINLIRRSPQRQSTLLAPVKRLRFRVDDALERNLYWRFRSK